MLRTLWIWLFGDCCECGQLIARGEGECDECASTWLCNCGHFVENHGRCDACGNLPPWGYDGDEEFDIR